MKFTKDSIKNIIFYSGLMLLSFLVTTLIISSVNFLFKGRINSITAVISIILSIAVFFLVTYKQPKTEAILGLILGVVIFAVFIFITQNILDFAHDSNWYHKAALGSLANGWNPVYEEFGEFANNSDLNITDMNYAAIFTQHYCKASWITGANIYCLTGNIETGKSVNLLMAYILFVLTFHYLSKVYLKWWQSLIVSGLMVYNPLTVSQIFTLYVDNLLYTCLFGIIVMLFGISDKKYDLDEKIKYYVLFGLVVFCVNIKFTGLAYAGVFCLLFYIIWIIHSIVNKNFKQVFIKNTVFYIITCSIAIFLVGFSTYVTNYLDDGHPLYPLAGENKRDIMTGNQPTAFNKINGIDRLLISVFSKTENITGKKLPDLKFPFIVYEEEEEIVSVGPDTRIAGFGPLFGGILCFSAAILTFGTYCLFKLNKYWFAIIISNIAVILTLLLCIEESWWARYSPYFYLIPMLALVIIFIAFNNEVKLFKCLIGAICAVCIFLLVKNTNYFVKYVDRCIIDSKTTLENLEKVRKASEDGPIKISLIVSSHYGIEFNLKDADINYVKVEPYTVTPNKLYGELMYVEDIE